MRNLLLIVVVLSGAAMAQEYPSSFDEVSNKYDTGGFASLNDKEQAIYTI